MANGVIVCSPDGNCYFVSQDQPEMVCERMELSKSCKDAFAKFCKCLKIIPSDVLVLSGVVIRANGVTSTRKPVGRRSAKK
jgi:hypothetical protein